MTTKNQKAKEERGFRFPALDWVNIDKEIWTTTKSGAVWCGAVCRLTFVGGGPLDQSVSQAVKQKRGMEKQRMEKGKEEENKAMKRMCAVH